MNALLPLFVDIPILTTLRSIGMTEDITGYVSKLFLCIDMGETIELSYVFGTGNILNIPL
jgi:hypothetical protein